MGRLMTEEFPGIEQTEMFRCLSQCMEGRLPLEMENKFVYPNGVKSWFELRFEPVVEGVAVLSFDVSRRRLAEEKWKRASLALRVMSDCHRLLQKVDDEATLFQRVCDIAVSSGDYRLAWIQLEMDDQTVRLAAMSGQGTSEVALATPPPTNETSSFALPLTVKDKVVGHFHLCSEDSDAFEQAERNVLAELASNLGYGIVNLRERKARRDSDAHYYALFEHSLDAVLLTTPEGEILKANPAACRLFQCSEAELRASGRSGLIDSSDPRVSLFLRQREQRGKASGALRLTRADGTCFEAECSSAVFETPEGPHNSVIIRDVTERVKNEALLRESEERFRTLFENMTAGFVLFEVVEGEPGVPVDLIIRAANAGFFKATGLTAATAIDQPLTSVLPGIENDSAGWIATYGSVGLTGEPLQFREGSELLDSYFSISCYRAAEKHCAVTFFDITEQQLAQEKLQKSEERYRRLAENLPDMVWRTDGAGQFQFVNSAVTDFLGFRPEEVLNAKFDQYFMPSSNVQVQGWLDSLKGTTPPRPSFFGQVDYLNDKGEIVPGELHAVTEFDTSGRLVAVEGVTRDIRERIKAELERHEIEAQLHQSQKLESVGRLAGGVAHDFNNLLSVIISCTEFAMTELEEPNPISEDLLEIQKAAFRASNLTRQLLAFSRRQVLAPEVLNLNTIVSGMETLLKRLLGEHIEVCVRCCPSLCNVLADPGQMEQVIMNLAINARDAMPSGGILKIETANYSDAESSETAVHLIVSDTGSGMDPETLQYVFEPFFTTKGPGKGTGLGLSTVYGIMKQSGGSVTVESSCGSGTVFTVSLPTVDEPEKRKEVAGSSALAGGGETVLVVEDDDSVRRVTERILTRTGFRVFAASGGDEALALIETQALVPDLLLTDIVMPKMNGRELAEEVLRRLPGVRVLYMSGYTDDAIVRHGLSVSRTQLVSKPFTRTDLTDKVLETLRRESED